MTGMVERLLEIAADLIDRAPRSGAAKRRAVSTAYYAAFHAMQEACASGLIAGADRTSAEYERVYRALDHGTVRNAFANSEPLRGAPHLRRIGDLFVKLQSERFKADYMPPRPNLFRLAEARDLLGDSRTVVEELGRLDAASRRTLAIHILIRDRRS